MVVERLRVAFCIRNDYLKLRGGDTIQSLQTKKYLEEVFGVLVTIIDSPEKLVPGDYDICHLFNIQKINDINAYLGKCRQTSVKVVLSPIIWDFTDVVVYTFLVKHLSLYHLSARRLGIAARVLKLIARVAGLPTIFTGKYREYLRLTASSVHMLLPNSAEEAEVLARLSGECRERLLTKTRPVVNAVEMAEPPPEAVTRFAEQYRIPPGYVLQVGRIEPGKNQYHVIEALMEDKEIPLVFVGNQRANSKYFRTTEVHAHKRGNVFFFDEVAQSELTLFYRNARLHILPSLGETTGLVSLEALACGCPIVVANERYCPFNSYFNGLATAVDPLCPEAIRAGIFSEFAVKRDMQTISRRIRLQYSWLLAARQTYEAYQCVVGHAEKLSSDKAEKVVAQHTKNGKSDYAI